jgi:hypothetical protein
MSAQIVQFWPLRMTRRERDYDALLAALTAKQLRRPAPYMTLTSSKASSSLHPGALAGPADATVAAIGAMIVDQVGNTP